MDIRASIRHGIIAAIGFLTYYGLIPAVAKIIQMRFDRDLPATAIVCLAGLPLIIGMLKKSRLSHIGCVSLFTLIIFLELSAGIRSEGAWVAVKASVLFFLLSSTLSAFHFHRQIIAERREEIL